MVVKCGQANGCIGCESRCEAGETSVVMTMTKVYIGSVDVNGLTDLSFARIWSSPRHFGDRATFQTQDRRTSLLIVNNIRGNESGLYRSVSSYQLLVH